MAQSDRDPLWIQVIGGNERFDGSASDGTSNVTNRSGGIAVGWDFSPTPNSILGVAIEGASSHFSVGALDTSGKVTTVSLAAYGALAHGPWSERFDLAVGRHHNTYSRVIPVAGVSETDQGTFDGDSYSAHAEIDRTFRPALATRITPFASLDVTRLDLDSYDESAKASGGAPGVLGLHFNDRDYTAHSKRAWPRRLHGDPCLRRYGATALAARVLGSRLRNGPVGSGQLPVSSWLRIRPARRPWRS